MEQGEKVIQENIYTPVDRDSKRNLITIIIILIIDLFIHTQYTLHLYIHNTYFYGVHKFRIQGF